MEACTLLDIAGGQQQSKRAGAGQWRAFVGGSMPRYFAAGAIRECDRGRGCGQAAVVCRVKRVWRLAGRGRGGESVYFVGATGARHFQTPAARSRPFCGRPLSSWLAAAGVRPNEVWHDVERPADRSLWNARVFPAEPRPRDSGVGCGCTRRSRPAPRSCAPTAGRPLQHRRDSPTDRSGGLSSAASGDLEDLSTTTCGTL